VDGNLLGRRNKVIPQVQPLLDYISKSLVLPTVEFHSANNQRRGLLDKLLRTPAPNSNIVEVSAHDNGICPRSETLAKFLTKSRSIRTMKGSVGIVYHSNPNTGQMLAAAFGQNQTLLDLELSVGQSPDVDIPTPLSRRLLSGIRRSNSLPSVAWTEPWE
jgi:hypothetical protein